MSNVWRNFKVSEQMIQSNHEDNLQGLQNLPVSQVSAVLCRKMTVSSVAQNRSTPGLPVHRQLPEFTQTHAHWVGDAVQPPHSS